MMGVKEPDGRESENVLFVHGFDSWGAMIGYDVSGLLILLLFKFQSIEN
jgi:hypothetical protein